MLVVFGAVDLENSGNRKIFLELGGASAEKRWEGSYSQSGFVMKSTEELQTLNAIRVAFESGFLAWMGFGLVSIMDISSSALIGSWRTRLGGVIEFRFADKSVSFLSRKRELQVISSNNDQYTVSRFYDGVPGKIMVSAPNLDELLVISMAFVLEELKESENCP